MAILFRSLLSVTGPVDRQYRHVQGATDCEMNKVDCQRVK